MGGILISRATYRHVRGLFSVDMQEPLHVKGKAEPVQTYVVKRVKPRAFRMGPRGVECVETQMIGRASELGQLRAAYHNAVDQH